MSLPVPLAVRIRTDRSDRHITLGIRDLSFRETDPGGYADAQFSLSRPLIFQPNDIQYFARCWIFDRRNGETVWEGMVEDLERTTGEGGPIWSLSALGPAAQVHDRTLPLTYVDRDFNAWRRVDANNIAGGSLSTCQDPLDTAGPQGLKLHFPQGLTHDNGSHVSAQWERGWHANQKIARFNYHTSGGGTDGSYLGFTELYVNGGGTAVRPRSETLAPSAGTAPKVIGTDWANSGYDTMRLSLWRSATPGPITTPNDGFWWHVHDLSVRTTLYSAAGVEQVSGSFYTADTVLASEVVADMLGRGLLPLFDGANAQIAATSYAIEQLAYPDGTTPGKVLDDLMVFEPLYTWDARRSNPTTGKYAFRWVLRPTTVRYIADVRRHPFGSPASGAELYNEALVRWSDVDDQTMLTTVTQNVPALTSAGRTRSLYLNLDGTAGLTGSAANATQAGTQALADHLTPPNAGTLTVQGPIYDALRGRMVAPWEIQSGYLIAVRGVHPNVSMLNPVGRDGAAIFRIASRRFSATATSAAATVDLDSYSLTWERRMAEQARQQQLTTATRRRR